MLSQQATRVKKETDYQANQIESHVGMASREGSSTSGTTNSQEQSPVLAAVQHLMDQPVQTAMQPITSELRSLMNKIQTGTLPAPRSNATPALNGGELSGAGASSSGVQGVSDSFPVLQAGGGPGLHVSHGFTTLSLPGGGGLGIGGTPSGSGAVCPLSVLRTPSLGYQGGLA